MNVDICKQWRRTPQGVRGLKCSSLYLLFQPRRRTPQGVRGLKFHILFVCNNLALVAPRKGCVD